MLCVGMQSVTLRVMRRRASLYEFPRRAWELSTSLFFRNYGILIMLRNDNNLMKKKMIFIKTPFSCLLLTAITLFSPFALSEITLDGSMGATGSLAGPDYQITEDLGQRAGSNLFHSFGQFNINSAESATFSGSADINNVISRVTGGQTSTIDGAFRSTIPGANIYFLNPSGVIFGKNASLDVQGSFHASTADYLKFKDGVKFETGLATANPVLTVASPEAFGFLDGSPAPITVSGGDKRVQLGVQKDATLSLVGGDISLKNVLLFSPNDQINVVSVGSAGEAVFTEKMIETASFNKMGNIHLNNTLSDGLPTIASLSDSAGRVFIRGGQMTMDNAVILTSTENSDGGEIDIGLTGDLKITNPLPTINIMSESSGLGSGGNINLKVAGLDLSQEAAISSLSNAEGNGGNINIDATNTISLADTTSIQSLATDTSTGNGGNISLKAENVKLTQNALIYTTTSSSGNAGNITIDAKKVFLSSTLMDFNDDKKRLPASIKSQALKEGTTGHAGNISISSDRLDVLNYAQITANTATNGNAGTIIIKANHLEMRNGGTILSRTRGGSGDGGLLDIKAENILLSGDDSKNIDGRTTRLGAETFDNFDSAPGEINISTGSLEIREGASIATSSNGTGKELGGNITIKANHLIAHDGGTIDSSTLGLRQGGNINIEAETVQLSGEDTTFRAISGNIKDAGDITINATTLNLKNGAEINTSSHNKGRGGDVTITADTLEMNNKASIDTNTYNESGHGGNLAVDANTILLSGENTKLSSSSFFGSGDAGDITVISDYIALSNGASFETDTNGLGQGGNLTVNANTILLSDNFAAFITNSQQSSTGDAGNISVTANHLELKNNAIITSDTLSQGIDGYIEAINNPKLANIIDIASLPIEENRDSIGNAGTVTIDVGKLDISNGSRISAITRGKGQGGDLNIDANSMMIKAENSDSLTGLTAQSRSTEDNAGDAGTIMVTTNHLAVHSGGQISTGTYGSGQGGNLTIDAQTILLSRDGSDYFTGIKSNAKEGSSGYAGALKITSDQLDIRNNAGISTNTQGFGQGGSLEISANDIHLNDANISSISEFSGNSSEKPDTAKSGNIIISANNTLALENNSAISVKTEKANAGEIAILGENNLTLSDSNISTSVANGEGNGGNISVNSPVVSLDNSQIIAQAKVGDGGDISVPGILFQSPLSVIDASSEKSTPGELNLKPDTNISGSIAVLPESLLNASEHLNDSCSSRSGNNTNSFVIKNRGGIPLSPNQLSPATFMDISSVNRYSAQKTNSNTSSFSLAENTVPFLHTQQIDCIY